MDKRPPRELPMMENYTGYLKPYVPLIAAMLLAGQRPKQVAQLLNAMGAGQSEWEWTDPIDEPLKRPNPIRELMAIVWEKNRKQALREQWDAGAGARVSQMTGSIGYLASKWFLKRKTYIRPVIRQEWTPESNWHEAQAVRAEG